MPLNRSENMARIRGQDTEPERLLRSALWSSGVRYRIQLQVSSIKLDIAFPHKMVGVCVDGCFWHGCPAHYVFPRTRREFWSKKLRDNVDRDRRQTQNLESQGWRIFRFWEHEIYENMQLVRDLIVSALSNHDIRQGQVWKVVSVEILDQDADTEKRFLETLRHPVRRKMVERKRTTTKWVHSRLPSVRTSEKGYEKRKNV